MLMELDEQDVPGGLDGMVVSRIWKVLAQLHMDNENKTDNWGIPVHL